MALQMSYHVATQINRTNVLNVKTRYITMV